MLRAQAAPALPAEVHSLAVSLKAGYGSLQEAFRALDTKGHGFFTQSSFAEALQGTAFGPRAEALFRALDKLGFGRLNLQTFLAGFGVSDDRSEASRSRESSATGDRRPHYPHLGSPPVSGAASPPSSIQDRRSLITPANRTSQPERAGYGSVGLPARAPGSLSLDRRPALAGGASPKAPGLSPNPQEHTPSASSRQPLSARVFGQPRPAEAGTVDVKPAWTQPRGTEPQRLVSARRVTQEDSITDSISQTSRSSMGRTMRNHPQEHQSSGGDSGDSSSRLEERVAAFHASLESMLEDRLGKLAAGLRAEWTQMLQDEQAKFSLRTAALGQAVVKECEGKLSTTVSQEVRSEVKLAIQQEMQGIQACFRGQAQWEDETASRRRSEHFNDFHSSFLMFEQRIMERASNEAQRQFQPLRQEVSALHNQQDRLVQQVSAVDSRRGGSDAGGEGVAITRESLVMLFDDIRNTIQEMSRSLREDADRLRRECRDIWLEEAKVRDDSDDIMKRSLEKLVQALRADVTNELDSHRTIIRSLAKCIEGLEDGPGAPRLVHFAADKNSAFSGASITNGQLEERSTASSPRSLGSKSIGMRLEALASSLSPLAGGDFRSLPPERPLSARGDKEAVRQALPGTAPLSQQNLPTQELLPKVTLEDQSQTSHRGSDVLNNAEVLSMIEELRKEVSNVREENGKR